MAIVVTLSGIACMYVGYHFVGLFDFVVAAFLTWAALYNILKYGNKKPKNKK